MEANYVRLGLYPSSALKAQTRLRLENFRLVPPRNVTSETGQYSSPHLETRAGTGPGPGTKPNLHKSPKLESHTEPMFMNWVPDI